MNLPTLNNQPVEKQNLREDGQLEVYEIFKTIQGEGPFTGTPAIFVRLAGCNLECKFCDTLYSDKRTLMSPEDIVLEGRKRSNWKDINLCVLTGGEPFRQNITPLVEELMWCNYKVQIETNGTLYVPIVKNHDPIEDGRRVVHRVKDTLICYQDQLSIICSPKTPKISPELEPWINCWKYILSEGNVDPIDGLPTNSLGYTGKPYRPKYIDKNKIYVQPQDDKDEIKNKKNIEACIQSCYNFGYKISLQTHKIMGLE